MKKIGDEARHVHSQRANDLGARRLPGWSGADLIPTRTATRATKRQLLLRLARRWLWCRWRWAVLATIRLSDDDVLDVPSTAAQHLIHGGPSIRAEMKSVGHLDRVRRPLPAAFGVRTGTIAHDDLDTRVAAQPVGEHFGSAIVK